MKNVTELLHAKELQAERLTREIKVLRVAAQILAEEERLPAGIEGSRPASASGDSRS